MITGVDADHVVMSYARTMSDFTALDGSLALAEL